MNDIEAIENVTINGNNPQILTYEFNLNGQKTQSKFSVFDPEKTKDLKKGHIIPIKHLNGKIKHLMVKTEPSGIKADISGDNQCFPGQIPEYEWIYERAPSIQKLSLGSHGAEN